MKNEQMEELVLQSLEHELGVARVFEDSLLRWYRHHGPSSSV
jgi:hypothetical protein